MIPNLVLTFVKKAIYGIVGNVGAALLLSSHYQPAGDRVDLYIWQSLGVGLFTGLAAVVKRLLTWKAIQP